jgi:hypothetical protein
MSVKTWSDIRNRLDQRAKVMSDDLSTDEQKRKHAQAVKTAWLLGFIALAIFVAFIGAAVVGN